MYSTFLLDLCFFQIVLANENTAWYHCALFRSLFGSLIYHLICLFHSFHNIYCMYSMTPLLLASWVKTFHLNCLILNDWFSNTVNKSKILVRHYLQTYIFLFSQYRVVYYTFLALPINNVFLYNLSPDIKILKVYKCFNIIWCIILFSIYFE